MSTTVAPLTLAPGYSVVHRDAVMLNGIVFFDMLVKADDPCCLVLPSGKAAMSQDGGRPHTYRNMQEAIDDSHVLNDIVQVPPVEQYEQIKRYRDAIGIPLPDGNEEDDYVRDGLLEQACDRLGINFEESTRNQAYEAMARHVLATVHADDNMPADAEWITSIKLPWETEDRDGAKIYKAPLGAAFVRFAFHYRGVSFEAMLKTETWQVLASSYLWNPTRSQVRYACLSMGHTLNEGTVSCGK